MVRFYCDYCKSYLTHDAASVRKNHLSGKNHVKLVCDYYEEKAKELGIWDQKVGTLANETGFELTIDKLYRGIPGSEITYKDADYYKLAETKLFPPPPNLSSLPQPPPKILHETSNKKEMIGDILKTVT
ncbi:hypothetical protein WICMUC_004772 [Wickerhamomyces mucosus]|uniref:Matrin-type domain-containing protein n=1 Tax=Wickerhamomyces mucosus TaxID=1378264 RepID=A0A9P8T9S8_9ASCO|nr:hypothetical protein WICMUC_004772 [Wickerhamomyces mucosus]